jgi:hypothetical protein
VPLDVAGERVSRDAPPGADPEALDLPGVDVAGECGGLDAEDRGGLRGGINHRRRAVTAGFRWFVHVWTVAIQPLRVKDIRGADF